MAAMSASRPASRTASMHPLARERRAAGDVLVEAAGHAGASVSSTVPIWRRTSLRSSSLEILAVVEDAAARRRLEAEQQAQQRRLARARRADDGEVLARAHLEVDVLEDPRAVRRCSGTTGRARRCCPPSAPGSTRLASTSSGASNTGRNAGEQRQRPRSTLLSAMARPRMAAVNWPKALLKAAKEATSRGCVAAAGDGEDADACPGSAGRSASIVWKRRQRGRTRPS